MVGALIATEALVASLLVVVGWLIAGAFLGLCALILLVLALLAER